MNNKLYKIFNLSIAAITLLILIYCGFYFYFGDAQVSCIHKSIYGKVCPSCGFSRAFASFVYFDFEKGNSYNPYALTVYCFIVFQFVWRMVLLIFRKSFERFKTIGFVDAIISFIVFVWAFLPLLKANILYYLR